MLTQTIKKGKFVFIDDQKSPNSFKELLGFLVCNKGNDCFAKFQGNVWKITRENSWKKVCKNISDLSFSQYLKISKE